MEPIINSVQKNSLTQKPLEARKEELKKACREFESLFTAYILKSMRSTVLRAEEPQQAREIYEAMFDEALAREISLSGALGLGDLIYKQLEPLLEAEAKQKPLKEDTP
ncbi:MAG: rod-binding protein [Thermodesulforhabdaceae bacterium]|jgi:flagellar protein FlgJ